MLLRCNQSLTLPLLCKDICRFSEWLLHAKTARKRVLRLRVTWVVFDERVLRRLLLSEWDLRLSLCCQCHSVHKEFEEFVKTFGSFEKFMRASEILDFLFLWSFQVALETRFDSKKMLGVNYARTFVDWSRSIKQFWRVEITFYSLKYKHFWTTVLSMAISVKNRRQERRRKMSLSKISN